jgi:DNA-binding MarR family transcriptional regulator
MPTPSDAAVSAWTRLIRAHTAAVSVVEAALKAEGLPPLEWYDVLLELERGGPQRPRDLQARLLLAQYNLSRLLDRLSEAGLVAREALQADKRGHLVMISAEGSAMRARMWPVYARAIQAAVGDKLSDAEATVAADLLGRLAVRP